MRRVIQVENIKTFSSNSFRVIISLHLLFFILVLLSLSRIELSMGEFSVSCLFSFPALWEFFPWIASWFNLLLAVLIIVLTCNEFRYNTFRFQIMNGFHQGHLLAGKVYIMVVIALYALLLVILSGLVSGAIQQGGSGFSIHMSGFNHVGIYFLQTLAYMSLALFFAVLLRNNALAIVVFMLYLFPGEVILRKLLFSGVEAYFPAKLIGDLTPLPSLFTEQISLIPGADVQMSQQASNMLSLSQGAGFAVLYTLVFLTATYLILKNRSF